MEQDANQRRSSGAGRDGDAAAVEKDVKRRHSNGGLWSWTRSGDAEAAKLGVEEEGWGSGELSLRQRQGGGAAGRSKEEDEQ